MDLNIGSFDPTTLTSIYIFVSIMDLES